MADGRESDSVFFMRPDYRGIIPLDGFHVSRSLSKLIRKNIFKVTYNQWFKRIMHECAVETEDRPETWINDDLIFLYHELHKMGHAHSVEVWRDERLVGGLYGVSIGGAFFGESMFSRQSNTSKIALVFLVNRLKEKNYLLLDTQFLNPHLEKMGAIEITADEYMKKLDIALKHPAIFDRESFDKEGFDGSQRE